MAVEAAAPYARVQRELDCLSLSPARGEQTGVVPRLERAPRRKVAGVDQLLLAQDALGERDIRSKGPPGERVISALEHCSDYQIPPTIIP